MDPISTRELVAWVLVLGLLVTLASSKRRTPTNSNSSVQKQATDQPKSNVPKGKKLSEIKLKFETTPPKIFGKVIRPRVKKKQPESDFLKDEPTDNWLDKAERDQKSRSTARKVASVPKPDRSKRAGRGGPSKVSGSSDRPSKVRDRKAVKRHGSAPHQGKKRSAKPVLRSK